MSETIEIKQPDVVRDIKKLAERTGKPVTDAVAEAVRAKLGGGEPPTDAEIAERSRRVEEALARYRALPHAGEPLTDADLYDEDGFPK